MGKGDTPRPVNKASYDKNYERLFGLHRIKVWEDAPQFTDGGGEDGGQVDDVSETTGGPDDPSPPNSVEAEGRSTNDLEEGESS